MDGGCRRREKRSTRPGRVFAVAALAAGCAQPPPPAAPEAPEPEAQASPRAFVLPEARVVAYANWSRMDDTPVSRWLGQAAKGAEMAEVAAEVRDSCGIEPKAVVDEVVVSLTPQKDVLVAASVELGPEEVASCFGALFDSREREEVGEHMVATGGGRAGAWVDGVFILGSEQTVRSSVRSYDNMGGAVSRHLPDPRYAVASVTGSVEGALFGAISLVFEAREDEDLDYRLSFHARTAGIADWLTRQARDVVRNRSDLLLRGTSAEARPELVAVLAETRVSRAVGQRAELAGRLPSRASREELDAVVSRLVTVLEQRHALDFARAEVVELAEKVKARALEGERPRPRLVASIPASSADDPHPDLAELGFQIGSPFSFAIDTSRWRQRAVVEAEGDHDGDGEPTRLSVTVRVQRDGAVELGELEEEGDLEE